MYGIQNFGDMLTDATRMDAFERALRGAVTPGKVVLDIGTGTGIFALISARLGARRVFAIEPSDAIFTAREIAAANGLSDRIEFIQDLSTRVDLPERADVIVSDLHGVLPHFGRHIESIADARRRHLAPGGILVPRRDIVRATVVHAPEAFARITSPWSGNDLGFDMSAACRLAANTATRVRLDADRMLSSPQVFTTLDYAEVDAGDFRAERTFVVDRAAQAHGLCVWFDTELFDGVTLSNAPSNALIYGSLFLPWREAVALSQGDKVDALLRADFVGDDFVWSWTTRIGPTTRSPGHAFEQSELLGEMMSPHSLRRQAASHVPDVGEDGSIDAFALRLMVESHSLGDIARQVAERFPRRFADASQALTRVGELSRRYSR